MEFFSNRLIGGFLSAVTNDERLKTALTTMLTAIAEEWDTNNTPVALLGLQNRKEESDARLQKVAKAAIQVVGIKFGLPQKVTDQICNDVAMRFKKERDEAKANDAKEAAEAQQKTARIKADDDAKQHARKEQAAGDATARQSGAARNVTLKIAADVPDPRPARCAVADRFAFDEKSVASHSVGVMEFKAAKDNTVAWFLRACYERGHALLRGNVPAYDTKVADPKQRVYKTDFAHGYGPDCHAIILVGDEQLVLPDYKDHNKVTLDTLKIGVEKTLQVILKAEKEVVQDVEHENGDWKFHVKCYYNGSRKVEVELKARASTTCGDVLAEVRTKFCAKWSASMFNPLAMSSSQNDEVMRTHSLSIVTMDEGKKICAVVSSASSDSVRSKTLRENGVNSGKTLRFDSGPKAGESDEDEYNDGGTTDGTAGGDSGTDTKIAAVPPANQNDVAQLESDTTSASASAPAAGGTATTTESETASSIAVTIGNKATATIAIQTPANTN